MTLDSSASPSTLPLPIDLDDLRFGRDDAESDIGQGGLLRDGFLPTAASRAVRRASKTLIIGRKGSGKSAICRVLAAERGGDPVWALVTPDNVSADEIRRFELQGVGPELAKSQLWHYVLVVEVAKHLLAHAERDHPGSAKLPSVRALRSFLEANGETARTRPKFWQVTERLKGKLSVNAFVVNADLEFGGADPAQSPSEGTRLGVQLDLVDEQVRKVIADLDCPDGHPGLTILVDQVEEVWTNSGESDSLVVGLLRAARDVSAFPGVTCVTFLRTDIYDLLQFSDKDKYRSTEMRLEWSPERLLSMVLARARAATGREVTPERLWGEVFPATVGGEPVTEYLVRHTLRRPRDIVHLCNLCRDTAEGNGHDRIEESDVLEATVQYSKDKVEDLVNEYRNNYPYLGSLLTLFKDRGLAMTRAAFEEVWERAAPDLRELYSEHLRLLEAREVLEVLFEVGFLGVCRTGGRVLYSYEERRVERGDRRFQVHPMFRAGLRITEDAGCAAQEPEGDDTGARLRAGWHSVHAVAERLPLEGRLVRSALGGLERLRDDPNAGALPEAVRERLRAELGALTERVEGMDGMGYSTTAIRETVQEVGRALVELSERYEADEAVAERAARYHVRSLGDVGRRLQDEALGTTWPSMG